MATFNLRVRAKAAVAISMCIKSMGHEAMKEFGLAALLKIASQLLNDRLPEARAAARCVMNSVYGAFSSETESAEQDDGAPGLATCRLGGAWHGLLVKQLQAPLEESNMLFDPRQIEDYLLFGRSM